MLSILQYVRDFYTTAFNWLYLFCLALGLGLLVYLNYWHGINAALVHYRTGWNKFAGFYLLFLVPFAGAFLLQPLFFGKAAHFRNRWFWLILMGAPAFFAAKMSIPVSIILPAGKAPGAEMQFWNSSLAWVWGSLISLVPVLLIWYMKDRQQEPFYGMARPHSLTPYFILLLFMIPLVLLAARQPAFLEMYPRSFCIQNMNVSQNSWRYLLYEICYGFDFVGIEFFFRGFLVLALLSICGQHCILPMACFYCTIHFGKPLPEAISSVGGGWLLGIISYHTRSIWGGILVHLGIAWLMELAGWLIILLH